MLIVEELQQHMKYCQRVKGKWGIQKVTIEWSLRLSWFKVVLEYYVINDDYDEMVWQVLYINFIKIRLDQPIQFSLIENCIIELIL